MTGEKLGTVHDDLKSEVIVDEVVFKKCSEQNKSDQPDGITVTVP